MDELEDDGNGPDIDVAALMGFGSFGDQHRGKRRRYNGRAEDAVVDGGPSPSGRRKERGSGSGSNNLPLGTGRSRPEKSDGITAERTSVGKEISTKAKTRGRGSEDAQGTGDDGGDGMESIALLHAASRQAEQTRSSSDMLPPTQPSATTGPSLPPKPPQPLLSQPENAAPASATGTGKGIGEGTETEAWKLRKGIKLANGEIAYYDASFVEDPWREWR